MALIPTKYTRADFDPAPGQDVYQEGMGAVSVESGYYVNPSRPDEEILIETTKTMTNQYGDVIRRDEEEYLYDVPGGPPTEYNRKVFNRVYLPGMGRDLHEVEREVTVYWPFTPLTKGDNLGRTRYISAMVVYDLPEDPTAANDSESQAAEQEAGVEPGTTRDRVVQSGKLWSAANLDNNIVPEAQANQVTKWVENVLVEHDLVDEEWDKWTVWTLKKNSLRSGGVEWEGPKYIRKTGIKYKLPVPILPPKITITNLSNGLRVNIKGGGARIVNRFYHTTIPVPPDEYHVYRKTIAEPERDMKDDLYGWWETPPSAEGTRRILENTDVTDLAGAPASPLPMQQSYTEPNDAEEPEPPPETSFKRIATVPNVNVANAWDEGEGSFLDEDVEDTAEYEYYATAARADQESEESNHETRTFSGSSDRKYRIGSRVADDGSTEVDAVAPDDPAYAEDDYGELMEFELPTLDDPLDLARLVADRQFAANRAAELSIRLTLAAPVLGIEFGQAINVPNIVFETFGMGLHLSTRTESQDWTLVGFERRVTRSSDGTLGDMRSVLRLQERARQ